MAFALEDYGVGVFAQLLVGKLDDVGLRNLLHSFDLMHHVGPADTVDKGVDVGIGAALVRVIFFHQLQLVVGHAGTQQRLVEVALAQFSHLLEQQVARLFERLTVLRPSVEEKHAVIREGVGIAIGREHLLRVDEIEVDEACLIIVEQRGSQDGQVVVR